MKKLDIILVIFFPILSSIISLALKANLLVSTLLFFGMPSIWLSYRSKDRIIKSASFSLIFSIPFTIVFEYLATLDKSWVVRTSIFPFRLFNIILIESLIWGFLFVYFVIIFYVHFLDKGKPVLIDPRMKYLACLLGILLLAFFIALFTNSRVLEIKYAYFWNGLIFGFMPTTIFLLFFPELLSQFVKTAVYFFFLSMLYELTALELGLWMFPGANFIGWVELLDYRFPFEEFFFWCMLSSASVLSYYEFFDDDRK